MARTQIPISSFCKSVTVKQICDFDCKCESGKGCVQVSVHEIVSIFHVQYTDHFKYQVNTQWG